MALCTNCHSADTRPTKTQCVACYRYQHRNGKPRPETTIIKHNIRQHEKTYRP